MVRSLLQSTAVRYLSEVISMAGLALVCWLAAAPPVGAQNSGREFHAGGLAFSIATAGAEIVSISGTGTSDDPIVIVERVRTLSPIRLVVRRMPTPERDKTTYQSALGDHLRFTLTKVVINATGQAWGGYDLELQERLNEPSSYGDGLSFDQLRSFRDVRLGSDRFQDMYWSPEPYDRLKFRHGAVDVGDRTMLAFAITDISPVARFFLFQQPVLVSADAGGGRRFASR